MNKIILAASLTFMLAAGSAAFAQAPERQGRAGPDTNKDGVITRAEMLAGVETMFARVDADRDGRITQTDRQQMATKMGARAPGKARGDQWAKLDTNADGSISKSEWDAAKASRGERRGARGDHAGGGHHGGGKMGGAMLKMADANNDGAITLAEARTAASAHFDRADTNRDGNLTREEMRAGHQAKRAQRQPAQN